ncbi:FHA domain-containing protein [Nocardioides humilatus]|uniref:FHA domain-containing protein n=1 Tax=Nocardioides humilatus TaxID=2607660 RepID=A0A5B1LE19_9ACTN|nr:FHA domain-containing protein [Nocardioides humilatus]KAA1418696.1 FHA domain-containing protein [Nocardioides humilatus]
MSPLVVEVDGRVLRLEGKSVVRIGRAIDAEVVLTAGSVSRQHAELRPVDGRWVLVDTGSQFGTYVDGRRVSEYPITGRTHVRCGPAAPGAEFVITPADAVVEAVVEAGDGAPPAPLPPPAPAMSFEEPTTGPMPGERPVAQSRFAPPPPPGPSGTHVARPKAPIPPPPVAAPGLDQTQVLAAQPAGPVRQGGPSGPPPVRSGPDLLIVAEGKEHRFRHPAQITIGRLPECTVVLSDPAASRSHGIVTAVPNGWTYTNQSNEGTYINGRRVGSKQFDERLELRLGHPIAGPEVTLVPILSAAEEEKRIVRRRLVRGLLVAGTAAGVLALVVVIAAVAVVLSRNDGSGGMGGAPSIAPTGTTDTDGGTSGELTETELDAAKAATVKIVAQSHDVGDDQEFTYAGSGSIIRADGLILTNAHVAAPEAPGVVEQYGPDAAIANPEFLLISITDGMTDTTAPPEYRARLVSADGYLDVAVIQIYAQADGSELAAPVSLPTVPIGSSEDVRAGDDVTVLGFPAVAGSGDSITVTTGAISTVLNDPDLGPRSEFDTEARIAPGNSGGMAIDNDGRLIGLPTALEFDPSGTPVTSGRIRAIDPVKPIIAQAEQQVG